MSSWELATRDDIAVTTAELHEEFAVLRADMREMFRKQTNRLLMIILPSILAGQAAVFLVARFGA